MNKKWITNWTVVVKEYVWWKQKVTFMTVPSEEKNYLKPLWRSLCAYYYYYYYYYYYRYYLLTQSITQPTVFITIHAHIYVHTPIPTRTQLTHTHHTLHTHPIHTRHAHTYSHLSTPHIHSAPNTHWIKYHWFCFYHTGVSQSGSIFAKGGASVCARMSNDDIAAFPNVSVVLQVWPRSFPGNNIIFFLIIVFLYLFADFSSFACAHWGKIFNHFNNQLF